jgi:Ca2+-transporting ATPase
MNSSIQLVEPIGLSATEAQQRFQSEGPNELTQAKKRTWLIIILEVLREPMFLLLLASSVIYLLLGDTHEALMLMSMILLVIGITFYQENKTEHTLEALRNLSSPKAVVIRDGETQQILSREVVRDDLTILSEGDRVPADGLLISGPGLSVDESLLTGESVAVRRDPGETDESQLYAGTLIVQGQGVMRVQKIGMQTELGKIGRSLETLDTEDTLLQKEVRRLVRYFAIWGVFLCLLVLLAYGFIRGGWMNGLLAGITLAMSVLPEEFPMVLTVFLALGAWRIAKSQVLTRRTHAIEALGAATILCTDKTGTLTINRMTVVHLANKENATLDLSTVSENTTISSEFTDVLTYGALASQPEGIDPMDKSAREAASQRLAESVLSSFNASAQIYPISKDLLAVTLAWPQNDHSYMIATKGAPETVLKLCSLNKAEQEQVIRQVHKVAEEGLRVLAVAKAHWNQEILPESPEDFPFEYVGLLGYMDPIRPVVPEAIRACHTAGIRVIMITGDYPETARSIARQIGLKNPDDIITGQTLTELSDEALKERVQTANTFARMVPEQKLRLVNAFKAQGEIVAMTGDGVNDAPALKAAHIGIAMGKRGTDVAREAAHLVLLEDDFASIVQAIRLGRRIFDNLRKAMAYIFTVHIPIAGMSLIPILFNWPMVLFPAHIALLEMIIDPACSIAFEAEPPEEDVMTRPPRPFNEPLFGKQTVIQALLQGNSVLLVILAAYGYAIWSNYGEAEARTMGFTTLLVSNLMLITVSLAGQTSVFKVPFLKNKAYWWVIAIALFLQALILTIPMLRKLFQFTQLQLIDYGICLGAALSCLFIMEACKSFRFSQPVQREKI